MLLVTLLAISLSIDALGIGLSYGIRNISIPFFTKLILLLENIFFMAVFILLGNHIKLFFSAETANTLGIILLLFMGIWFCYQSIQKKQCQNSIEMLRNPSYCDKDNSSHIDAKEGLCLGFILSIDSMGAGIAAGAAQICIILLPFFTAVFQILFLSIGIYCGRHLKNCYTIKENIWTAFSGCILIMIALIRILF